MEKFNLSEVLMFLDQDEEECNPNVGECETEGEEMVTLQVYDMNSFPNSFVDKLESQVLEKDVSSDDPIATQEGEETVSVYLDLSSSAKEPEWEMDNLDEVDINITYPPLRIMETQIRFLEHVVENG